MCLLCAYSFPTYQSKWLNPKPTGERMHSTFLLKELQSCTAKSKGMWRDKELDQKSIHRRTQVFLSIKYSAFNLKLHADVPCVSHLPYVSKCWDACEGLWRGSLSVPVHSVKVRVRTGSKAPHQSSWDPHGKNSPEEKQTWQVRAQLALSTVRGK